MWRYKLSYIRKVLAPFAKEKLYSAKTFSSAQKKAKSSTMKLTLVSAGVGILGGAAYGGYTHYKINEKQALSKIQEQDYCFFNAAPEFKPHYKVMNETDKSDLKLVLFQYRTCPFCCKVRAYLDFKGISYDVVEVDAVLRQAIHWSKYKKVPILLAKVDGGYQQLVDSTAIISILETYFKDESLQLRDVIKFYPTNKYLNESGKNASDIANKYYIMHNAVVVDQKVKEMENEERKWRQWTDKVLVHTLSPNVYRTMGEALNTFKWFEEAGGWRQSFPTWECLLMVYGGAAAMWIISKKLKARHQIKDDPRQSLYDAANEWMTTVKKYGNIFLGGSEPNLADISVFGVLNSIEGCEAFQDLRRHTDIGQWYDNMKSILKNDRAKVVLYNSA